MKINKLLFLLTYVSVFTLFSCDNQKETQNTESTATDTTQKKDTVVVKEDTAAVLSKNGLTLTPLKGSPEFPDAILEVNTPAQGGKLKPGKATFKYVVKNYQLKAPTDTAACNKCNNSKDGQHIHLILNNEPYIAVYQPEHTLDLKEGHYVALNFLSRSYHESIKEFQAFDVRQFNVGNSTKEVDLTKPLLFYSRPKGEYEGEYAKRILFDFYLVNTDLVKHGYKVRATINGTEFIIPKWQPYIIEGLPMGESTVKIELIDKDGKPVDSPVNGVERKITLKEK